MPTRSSRNALRSNGRLACSAWFGKSCRDARAERAAAGARRFAAPRCRNSVWSEMMSPEASSCRRLEPKTCSLSLSLIELVHRNGTIILQFVRERNHYFAVCTSRPRTEFDSEREDRSQPEAVVALLTGRWRRVCQLRGLTRLSAGQAKPPRMIRQPHETTDLKMECGAALRQCTTRVPTNGWEPSHSCR